MASTKADRWLVVGSSDSECRDVVSASVMGPDGKRWYADHIAQNMTPENAALVASAPALLSVLQRVADYWAGGDVPEELDREMRSILKQAKGGAR